MDKTGFFDKIFPVKYDFYDMLRQQANATALGICALKSWMDTGSENESRALSDYVRQCDEIRFDMEKKLIEAFTTPFDRTDIYSFSIDMDRIIEYAQSTLISMRAFDVAPDDVILRMTDRLCDGIKILSQSVDILEENAIKAEQNISKIRAAHTDIEALYRYGMEEVFKSGDAMEALKKREVYHHIKDASSNLDYTVDIFHRIVVRVI